jgi:sugar phosphate permease
MSLFYLLIPVIPLFGSVFSSHFPFVLLVCFFLFGFLQFTFQPTLSREMKKYYTREQHEGMFTCWDSGKHLGRILGFAFMQLTVIGTAISWEASLIILLGLMLAYIGLIFYELDLNEESNMRLSNVRHSLPAIDPETAGITWAEFISFGKMCMVTPATRYYVLLSCCFKAMSFNFTYWLSSYLFSYNYPQLSGKVTLVFVIPIYCGNFLIGKMHEDAISNEESLTNSNIFLILSSLFSFAGLNYLSTPASHMNYIQFVLIIMLEGFLIGGFYNILKSNQNLCGDFSKREKDMLDTFISAVINYSAAVVTLAIGVTLTTKAAAGNPHP